MTAAEAVQRMRAEVARLGDLEDVEAASIAVRIRRGMIENVVLRVDRGVGAGEEEN